MKRNLISTVALLLAATVSISAQTQEEIDGAIKALMNRNRVLGTEFAIVKHNKIVYTAHYGAKDTSGTPFTGTEIYPLASVSKSFTATAIMTLVEKGLLSLDADISNYLPIKVRNPRYPDTPITVRMFLNHTSSVIDAGGSINLRLESIDSKANPKWKVHYADYAPGEKYSYSNLCYNALGIVVERVSGMRFDRYVRKEILEPLGIEASFNVEDLDRESLADVWIYSKKAKSFSKRKNITSGIDSTGYTTGMDGDLFHGSWAMRTDIVNLARWMMFHINRGQLDGVRIISEESAIEMQTGTEHGIDNKKNVLEPVERLYGLGLYETDNWIPGKRACGHSGHITGIRTSMMFNVSEDWGIVTISPIYYNNDGYAFITDLNRTLHGLFIGFDHRF